MHLTQNTIAGAGACRLAQRKTAATLTGIVENPRNFVSIFEEYLNQHCSTVTLGTDLIKGRNCHRNN